MKPKPTLRALLYIASSSLLSISSVHAADSTWNGITGAWSETLASGSWAAEPNPGSTISFPSSTEVKYTFPAGTKNFARLKVTGP